MLVPTTMALRLASKINRNILNSLSRRSQSSNRRHHEDVEDAFKPPESPNVAPAPHHISRAHPNHFNRPASERAVHRFSIFHQDEPKTRKLPTPNSIGTLEPRCFSPLKIMDQFPKSTLSPIQSLARLSATSRFFSSRKSKKCKKMKDPKSTCKKIKLERCKPSKFFVCTKKPYFFKDCKKKEAPYPSFSESCAEDPYNKPSECKLCPWRSHHHPTFKQPKKKFHSTAQDIGAEAKTKFEQRNKAPPQRLFTSTVYDSLNEIIAAPPAATKASEKVRKLVPNTLPADINQWMENLSRNPDFNKESMELKTKKKKKGGGKKPCVKFPFTPETYQIGKKKPKKKDKCIKKKRKVIIDCPEKKCMENKASKMLMKGKHDDDDEGCREKPAGRGKKKCPRADRRQRKEKKKPCKKPLKKPVICPEKPLIRKIGYKPVPRKPKKKSSGLELPEGAGPQYNPSFLRRPSHLEEKLLKL